jgi:RNA polymerase sigma factor (sigma-70 family)
MNRQVITHDSFEALLSWLGPTRDEGAQKYESIRTSLIRIFIKKGCTDPEDLTDITINRVAEKVPIPNYVGDPVYYFVGVARHVFREWLRRKEIAVEPSPVEPPPEIELDAARDCLRKCLARLPDDQRDLVLDYYVHQKRAKIELHRQLALEVGVSANALRIRAHRLRNSLEKCVMECLAA